MATLKLSRHEAISDNFPSVCMRCGDQATSRVKKTFSWSPSWVIFFVFLGLLPFVVLALVLTKRVRLQVPMCNNHVNHWWWRNVVTWGGLASLVAIGILAFVVNSTANVPQGSKPLNDLSGYLCVGV